MSNETITQAFIRRELEFRYSEGKTELVQVEIMPPAPTQDPLWWWCAYSIKGTDIQMSSREAGIDSVQALTLVLATIPTELKHIEHKLKGEFWFFDEPGHMFAAVGKPS